MPSPTDKNRNRVPTQNTAQSARPARQTAPKGAKPLARQNGAGTVSGSAKSPRPHANQTPDSSRRRNLKRKSRYYRERRRRMILGAMAAGLILLIFVFSMLLRGCFGRNDDSTVSSFSRQDQKSSAKSSAEDDTIVNEEDPDLLELEDKKEAVPMEPVTIKVSVTGDCTLGTDEYFDYSTSLNNYHDNYGPEYFFRNVKSIFEADDLTIANNEGTFTNSTQREDKQFAFKGGTEYSKIYSSSSVEAVNTANNHSSDYGEQSFADTMASLDAEGVVHFGYDETAVMEIKGVKVGLVGIYELRDHLDRTQQLKDNITKVKADGAQLVIVIFHWGNEKEQVPDYNQMTLGRLAIDEGADLVCGHHPHVLQGIETYKGRKIVYSLGNFCFGGNSYPSDMDSMIFQQTFTITEDGVTVDDNTNVIPVSISSDYGYNNYQPTPATGDEATRIMNKINERSSWIETPGTGTDGNGQ